MNRATTFLLAVAGLLAAAPTALRAQDEDAGPPPPRSVEIDGSAGTKISAEVFEPKGGGETKPVVVAIHGAGSDRTMWKAVAARLAGCGIGVVALDARVDPAAAAPWAGAAEDLQAAVKWARGTLLADAKKVALAGCGEGGNAAVAAARKDPGIACVLVLGPRPGAGGVEAGVASWDGRPLALVAGAKSAGLADLKKMAAPLAKHPRAETLLLDGAAGHGADLLAESREAADEVAQWLRGRLDRPDLDGIPGMMNVRESSGPGHIVLDQSSHGVGIGGGGGVLLHAYRAPGAVTGLGVLADPDPTATKLTEKSRRLTITPAPGKDLRVTVKVERWTGKAWKAETPFELLDCGGFSKQANVECCEVWLPPRVLGAVPFTKVAVAVCLLEKGRFTWEEAKDGPGTLDLGGSGRPEGTPKFRPFRTTDPSSWGAWDLD